MEFFNSLLHFFTDKSRGLSHKAVLTIFVLVLIVFIDNTLSFSYYYNTSNKIEQISELNKLLKNATLKPSEERKIQNLRSQIIDRKTWKDRSWDFISQMGFSSESENFIEISVEKSKEISQERSYWWHFGTSSWIWIILILMMPIVFVIDKSNSLVQSIGILLLIEPFLIGLAWIFAKVFSFIPILFGNPNYNYALNAILCFAFFGLFSLFGKKEN
ncbi:hypothetical protein [Maribacter sp. Hel_I_7]|uniref:hypothetical protein n=1 Tax=Maribacter sp. Hel_I_7 TaxID=1249997 RepID=UPI00047A797C|nr:hypothetical protein [Maribacter sp. Hel_I_7]